MHKYYDFSHRNQSGIKAFTWLLDFRLFEEIKKERRRRRVQLDIFQSASLPVSLGRSHHVSCITRLKTLCFFLSVGKYDQRTTHTNHKIQTSFISSLCAAFEFWVTVWELFYHSVPNKVISIDSGYVSIKFLFLFQSQLKRIRNPGGGLFWDVLLNPRGEIHLLFIHWYKPKLKNTEPYEINPFYEVKGQRSATGQQSLSR